VGFPLRPTTKAVSTMLTLQHEMMAQMYVEERLAMAAKEQLVREATQARRTRRAKLALTARVGRTLVAVGQRLEAVGAAERFSAT